MADDTGIGSERGGKDSKVINICLNSSILEGDIFSLI